VLVVHTFISHSIYFGSLKMGETEAPTPAKKGKTVKKPCPHPKYCDMITTAICTLKERSGSSRQAISKYIQANYAVGDKYQKHLNTALKSGVSSDLLKQVKGTGASGSFRIGEKPKKKSKAVKKPAAKKVAKKPKKKSATKKSAAKKPAAKKVAAKKPAAKKPAAKKPAAKKAAAKKPVAKKAAAAKKPVAKKAKKKSTKK